MWCMADFGSHQTEWRLLIVGEHELRTVLDNKESESW